MQPRKGCLPSNANADASLCTKKDASHTSSKTLTQRASNNTHTNSKQDMTMAVERLNRWARGVRAYDLCVFEMNEHCKL